MARLARTTGHHRVAGALSALLGFAACTADGDEITAGDIELRERYLIQGAVFGPDGATGYLAVVDDLSADGSVSLETAFELGGMASAAIGDDGRVYVGRAEEPVLRRYRVDELGGFELDGEISFANLGVTSTGGGLDPIHLLGADKAYFIDEMSLQVIVFNPDTMTITGRFSLDGLAEGDLSVRFGLIEADPGELVFSAVYQRNDNTAEVLGRMAIVDTASDTVSYAEQSACGQLAWSARDVDGNIYFASHPIQAALFAGGVAGNPAGEPCMVRKLVGADDYDSDYYVALNDLTGRPTGAVIQGPGSKAYLLAFDDDATPVTPQNAANLVIEPGWEYFSVTLGDEAATVEPVAGAPIGSGYGLSFVVEVGDDRDGTPFVATVTEDLSSSTLFDVSGDEGFAERLTLPGLPFGVMRLPDR